VRAIGTAALARHLPEAEVEGIAAGLHLLARLPPHLDERQIRRDARQRGIRLYGLTDYQFESHAAAPGLVLGYAGLPTHPIDDGIAELAWFITGSSGRPGASPIGRRDQVRRDRPSRSGELQSEVMGELAAAGDADLAEDGLEVVLDGIGADGQPGGDFLGAVPGKDAADHFLLASGEPIRGGQDGQDRPRAGRADDHADALGLAVGSGDRLAVQGDPLALAAAGAQAHRLRRARLA
jgi:hypothetical protein